MMKRLFFLSVFFLFACTKSSDNNKNTASLIGKWELSEQFTDPGDGSVTWTKTTTDAYIIFKNGNPSFKIISLL